jgi:hypothetical protein
MSDKKFKKDPENYAAMSVPLESEKAIHDFYEELSELRKKHGIRDLLCVVYGSIKYDDGEIGEYMTHSSFGNSVNAIVMAAFVYGQEKKANEELMGKLLTGKKK